MDRVRVLGAVAEVDPQQLALAAAQGRPRNPAVVGPGRVLDPRRHLDLLVHRDDLPLPQHAAAWKPGRLAPVEVAEDVGRVEAVGGVVDDGPLPEGRAVRPPAVDGRVGTVGAAARGGVGDRLLRVSAGDRLMHAVVGNERMDRRQRAGGSPTGQQPAPAETVPGVRML